MFNNFANLWEALRTGRVRILWLVLGALLLVSALPIGLYHRQVLQLSQEKLVDTERIQQTEITRSLAQEVQFFEANVSQQLVSQRQILALTGLINNVEDPIAEPKVTRLLEDFVDSNRNTFVYLTAVGKSGKGTSASQGNFRAEQDPFVAKALQRAFVHSMQSTKFRSDPLALAPDNRPAFVIAVPLKDSNDVFTGMLAAVVSLDPILQRLKDASVRGRTVFVVDHSGHIVAHPETKSFVPGADLSGTSELVKQVSGLPQDLRSTENVRFTEAGSKRPIEMVGTYSTLPDVNWAVIAQRRLDKAREDAGVTELNRQALAFVSVVVIIAILFGYFFAVGISGPIRGLAASTRAISRGEFHQRSAVRGASEISELAENFNKMAGDIEEYIERLKEAAEENRELFIGSIRMLAAAIDEKDPYTRGHSGRVAKYSMLIGQELGLAAPDLDKLRIAALLHDVGKIGVEDRVLKKPGSLTPEEFELMKQHTIKGANIMRPVSQLKEMLPGIELHHEHIDGRGYPYGLQGPQIPLMARIIGVADTLDAMTTNRPYQSAMDIEYALNRIKALAGAKFDPVIVTALESTITNGKLRLSAVEVQV
ncbi:MAG TPA: HD domain-containing phosphohydrolase [Candidatus Saccharimonadales bacterium]|jgi:putative nucleotidyltransferase with HDIG domain|nr:HD domain-containing phosphohydrolase [Candidatus Saccharimonadales bacterium]